MGPKVTSRRFAIRIVVVGLTLAMLSAGAAGVGAVSVSSDELALARGRVAGDVSAAPVSAEMAGVGEALVNAEDRALASEYLD